MFRHDSRFTSHSFPSSVITYIVSSSSSIPDMTPIVPFTHRRSKSFLIKIIWAPGLSTSSCEVGRLLSGKSPSITPSNVIGSPGSSANFFSLIESTVSRLVARVMYISASDSSIWLPYRVFSSCRSAAPAVFVRIWSRTLTKTGSVCLYTF